MGISGVLVTFSKRQSVPALIVSTYPFVCRFSHGHTFQATQRTSLGGGEEVQAVGK